MRTIIICLFLLFVSPLFAQNVGKGLGNFDILDGFGSISHSKSSSSYIRPVVFNSPSDKLVWGFGIRQQI